MSNEIQTKLDAVATFTITLAGLASGAARQSTIVANAQDRPAMIVQMRVKTGGAAPAAGGVIEVYLIRGNGSGYRSDGAGAVDAAIVPLNAQLIGTIAVTANANTVFHGDFDTSVLGPLDEEFGIIVRNGTSQALHGTEGDHVKQFQTYLPEIQ